MTTRTMADSKEFKPLKEFATLPVTDSSEIRIYADEFKGHSYGSIRTFVKRDDYSGPTKAGLTMNAKAIDAVLEALAKLPDEPNQTEDAELLRVPKKTGLELVVRVTLYRDTTGIDFREWIDEEESGGYKGWSKKGVRIAYQELPKVRESLIAMSAFLKGLPKKKA